jgi:plastocyanin
MGSTDRSLHRPALTLVGPFAALLLLLAACTTESGASTAPSVAASAAESMEASVEESMAASAEASEDTGEGDTVTLVDFAFDPAELTVAAGTTVTFVNEDSTAHTVTEGEDGAAAEGARFDDEVAGGESVEITFDDAGDYNITCRFHGQMNMVVHVE